VPAELADQFVYLLTRATAQTSAPLYAQVREFGLSVLEWRTLMTMGNEAHSIGNLAKLLFLKQPTLTRIIERLEESNLVERRPAPEDRRRNQVHLTAAGEALVARLRPVSVHHDAGLVSTLGAEDAATLKDALRVLIRKTA